MSVCYCGWEGDCLGQFKGPHVARKAGHVCPNCNAEVTPGQRCVDARWIWPEDNTGSFSRFHAECYELMEEFADEVCGGGWRVPFDLVEAAEHAVANAHLPVWRAWLDKYALTWEWTPEPPDPPERMVPDLQVVEGGDVRTVMVPRSTVVRRRMIQPPAPDFDWSRYD